MACSISEHICISFCFIQENEKKQKREPKETPEELQECEMVFADF